MYKSGKFLFFVLLWFGLSGKTVLSQDNFNSSKTYNLCWEKTLEISPETIVASDNVSKIIIVSNSKISAFELNSGQQLWTTELNLNNIADLKIYGNKLTIYGNETNLFSIETGLPEAFDSIQDLGLKEEIRSGQKNNPSKINQTVAIESDEKGNIISVDRKTNKISWKYKTGGKITSLTHIEEMLIASSLDNFIYAIALSNGKNLWKRRLSGRIKEKPLIFDNFIIANTVGGKNASLIDIKNGTIISKITLIESEFFVKPLLASKELLLFQTSDGVALFTREQCKK